MRRLVLALALLASPVIARVDAQASVRSSTPLLSGPGGRELATVRAGAEVRLSTGAGATRQGHTRVTLEGFVDASLLGPGRDSFPNVVKAPSGARLRSAARGDADILADLRDGMGLAIVSRSGTWVRVRRTAWLASSALGAGATATRGAVVPPSSGRAASTPPRAATPGAAAPAAQDSVRRPAGDSAPPSAPPSGALTAASGVALRSAPDGRTLATVDSGALLIPLARGSGWTRVRVEGWVRDDQVIPADTALQLALSGADLRAAPERYRGAVVRWEVQFISVQKADPLRRDLRPGEQYLLARGPGTESGLLYIAIPVAMLRELERLEPLDVIMVTARVRVGRSEPAGVPVLDLISAAKK